MATDTKDVHLSHTDELASTGNAHIQHGPVSGRAQVWHFIRHFLEMCLAMCIGGIPLIVLFFWGAAQFGYPDLLQRFPELSTLVTALILSLVMTVWMRFRGMAWRLTLEMSSTTIVVGILLVGLGWLGILPTSSLFHWMTRLACLVMLVPMLLRLDHYTGRMGHHGHAV